MRFKIREIQAFGWVQCVEDDGTFLLNERGGGSILIKYKKKNHYDLLAMLCNTLQTNLICKN